jgi:rare lipoprotein A
MTGAAGRRTTGQAGLMLVVLLSAACAGAPAPAGPAPREAAGGSGVEEGLASWYGRDFQGRRTASGVPFDARAMVAAHPTLPFGVRVRVHRVATGKSVEVRIVDRGPAPRPRGEGVIIDLSEAAATRLGFVRDGRTRVRLEVIETPVVRRGHGR